MGDKPALTLVAQPQDFFRELIIEALGKSKLATLPEIEFYLVNLLNQFMKADRLYTYGPEGTARDEPLALLVKEALEQPQSYAQASLFRHIGDVSLYKAGFFQDSLARKLVDVDYYIEMGGNAYKQVAMRSDEETLKSLYHQLSHQFGSLVEVLAQVSDKTAQKTEKDLLRMYELWVRTRSERAAKALQEAGILPNDTIKKDWH